VSIPASVDPGQVDRFRAIPVATMCDCMSRFGCEAIPSL
jgi:hypothetical protein